MATCIVNRTLSSISVPHTASGGIVAREMPHRILYNVTLFSCSGCDCFRGEHYYRSLFNRKHVFFMASYWYCYLNFASIERGRTCCQDVSLLRRKQPEHCMWYPDIGFVLFVTVPIRGAIILLQHPWLSLGQAEHHFKAIRAAVDIIPSKIQIQMSVILSVVCFTRQGFASSTS